MASVLDTILFPFELVWMIQNSDRHPNNRLSEYQTWIRPLCKWFGYSNLCVSEPHCFYRFIMSYCFLLFEMLGFNFSDFFQRFFYQGSNPQNDVCRDNMHRSVSEENKITILKRTSFASRRLPSTRLVFDY